MTMMMTERSLRLRDVRHVVAAHGSLRHAGTHVVGVLVDRGVVAAADRGLSNVRDGEVAGRLADRGRVVAERGGKPALRLLLV